MVAGIIRVRMGSLGRAYMSPDSFVLALVYSERIGVAGYTLFTLARKGVGEFNRVRLGLLGRA